jgi:hypothetical protein
MGDRKIEYEEAHARREDQHPLPNAVVYPCSEDALIGTIEAGEPGLIAPLLVGPKERMCRLTGKAQLDLWPHEVVAAAYAAESSRIAGNLVGGGRAGALIKGSLHTDPHARIFGLSLAVALAACLVLNAVSPSTRICQQSARDFGTTSTNSISASRRVAPAPEGGSLVGPFGTIRSKECATNQGGEEPGY